MKLVLASKPCLTVVLVLLPGKVLPSKAHAFLGAEENGGKQSFSTTPSTPCLFEITDQISISGAVKFSSKNSACLSSPSTDSAAEEAREQRCFPTALEAAGNTLPDDGVLWDSPEPQCRPCSVCTHSPGNCTQWELQLVPAHSLGAGLLPWEAK